jgi:hypothetical protein
MIPSSVHEAGIAGTKQVSAFCRASISNALLCDASFSGFQTKIFLDVLGQGVVNFVVTWHRLLLSGGWIVVDIVASTVPKKSTALLFNLADQFAALHSAISFVR